MNVLVFAPHPDDEVLGCGGTIARLAHEGCSVYVCVVTKGVEPLFSEKGVSRIRNEQAAAHEILGVTDVFYLDFPAAMLEESHRYELNGSVSWVLDTVRPELVFIPHFGDMQRDHGLVSEAVMVAVRPRGDYSVRKILSYETLSETEWNIPHSSTSFMPNCFIDISSYKDLKLHALAKFESQVAPFPCPRSIEAVEALAKLRGSTINVQAAEAFSVIREIVR
ncbi:PIG-L deacetylase family protein [Adlercreutzia sp. ZJ141]|uniref:PIG-L deacetylase family protein n=1 Tax=Adlercreutzia sp. ZJ141 TaxID=2709406 RepID=UPI0013E9B135|nr:PIG-L deacetylase family protein [Adlercreutzia sp. ZJ141]